MATRSSIPAWKSPPDRGAWRATVHGGCKEMDTTHMQTKVRKMNKSSEILTGFQGKHSLSFSTSNIWSFQNLSIEHISKIMDASAASPYEFKMP